MGSLEALLKANRRKKRMVLLAALLMLLTMMCSITLGNLVIPLRDVMSVFSGHLGTAPIRGDRFDTVVWHIRFPRVCLAAIGGALLAISGATFQGVFRNPLVEPYILGISSGAACGAAIAIVFLGGLVSVSLLSFVFALAAMLSAYGIATRAGQTPLVNLILAGSVVASVFSAILNLVKTFASDSKLREISFWLMGGFYTAKWNDVCFLGLCGALCFLILYALSWKLNVLSMGENEARSLGVHVGLLKIAAIGIATFSTAATVSTVGIVSWVGLMIPHACRMMIGADHRYLLPFSACLGGLFLVVCDTVARTVIMGEIPISIVTSLLGAPYLIFLLRRNRQAGME